MKRNPYVTALDFEISGFEVKGRNIETVISPPFLIGYYRTFEQKSYIK